MEADENMKALLQGLDMEKYTEIFEESEVDFDTFVNMTEDDMGVIGIDNSDDRKIFLDHLKPLHHLYADYYSDKAIDDLKIYHQTNNQLFAILANIVLIKRLFTKKKPRDTLLDHSISCSSTISILLSQILNSVKITEKELMIAAESCEPQKKMLSTRKRGMWTIIIVTSFTFFGLVASRKSWLRN